MTAAPAHVPLLHVLRDGLVESVHFGSVVVIGPDGEVRFSTGDVESPGYPRSAAKPLQAAAMTRLGLDLPDDLRALVAASHSGEDFHLAGVRRILGDAGCTGAHLRNPVALPYDPIVRDAWLAAGRPASKLSHNCSGKHAAMLAVSRAHGWSTKDYLSPDHPLQREIATVVAELAGEPIAKVATDGCGAPLFSISLLGLTRAIGRIGAADPETAEGAVAHAIRRHPEMLAGTRRDVTKLMRAVPGLIAKDGFEGVQVAALPDGSALGVKIADGGDRARLPVTLAALGLLGVETALDQDPTLQVTGELALAPVG
ncbi:asparaginase [Amycolatopsis magusensis]|uniref:asparaginase n=1 Tax=Amycolatopsis magusensis TaxID=882444 RepID=UPI0024A8CCA5|nr:asparaginase [Amycolatopsis magusensis]MDI5980275.1 asparaginase [Amycolatopsis magusensis]